MNHREHSVLGARVNVLEAREDNGVVTGAGSLGGEQEGVGANPTRRTGESAEKKYVCMAFGVWRSW